MVRSQEEGAKIADRLNEVSQRFLGSQISYLGAVLFDSLMQKAVKQRQAVKENSNFSVAGQQWSDIMRKVLNESERESGANSMQQVWKNLLWKEDYEGYRSERIA
jgi:MinD-like ATPase involved in chromosome partitioning or flagellar assembly